VDNTLTVDIACVWAESHASIQALSDAPESASVSTHDGQQAQLVTVGDAGAENMGPGLYPCGHTPGEYNKF
jgi:hypothetical protein